MFTPLEAWALVMVVISATSPEKRPQMLPLTWHMTEEACLAQAAEMTLAQANVGLRVDAMHCSLHPRPNLRHTGTKR